MEIWAIRPICYKLIKLINKTVLASKLTLTKLWCLTRERMKTRHAYLQKRLSWQNTGTTYESSRALLPNPNIIQSDKLIEVKLVCCPCPWAISNPGTHKRVYLLNNWLSCPDSVMSRVCHLRTLITFLDYRCLFIIASL